MLSMSQMGLGFVKTRNPQDDRRSYSSKAALGHQLAIAFNFKIELKNVVLRRVSNFCVFTQQGQKLKSSRTSPMLSRFAAKNGTSPLRPAEFNRMSDLSRRFSS